MYGGVPTLTLLPAQQVTPHSLPRQPEALTKLHLELRIKPVLEYIYRDGVDFFPGDRG